MEKVRLIEDKMTFEDLSLHENFKEHEKTIAFKYDHYSEMNNNRNDLRMLKDLQSSIGEFKNVFNDSLHTINNKIRKLDENTQRYKAFDQANEKIENVKARINNL